MQQIMQISTEVLKVHPRNQEFFDDIEGKAYEQFKESIKNEGVVTPLIVAPDMTIVSGHQRLKACEDLGIKKVPVIIREDLDDEDEKLKKLLATNFGRTKNDPAKQVKVASEYVELVGMRKGDNQHSIVDSRLPLKDIASQLGTSETTLKELLLIDRKLIPQIRELFDNGEINKKTANKVWCRLSSEEQEKFFNEIGRDKIAQMTQAQTQKYIDDLKRVEVEKQQLQSELQREKCKQPEVKVVEKVVDNTDYTTLSRIKKELESKDNDMKLLEKENNLLERKVKLNEQEAKEYGELKKNIEMLKSEKADIYRTIESATSISRLIVDIENTLQSKLAPIKYSRAVSEQLENDIVINNITEVVERVEAWCVEMRKLINKDEIVTVEVM